MRVYNVPFHTHYLIYVDVISLWAKTGLWLLCTHLRLQKGHLSNQTPLIPFLLRAVGLDHLGNTSLLCSPLCSIKNAHLELLSWALMLNLITFLYHCSQDRCIVTSSRAGVFVPFVLCFIFNIKNIPCNRYSRCIN